nr:MAG TPA: hypothetical protein [Bacteriophage sp.]
MNHLYSHTNKYLVHIFLLLRNKKHVETRLN